jgi:hypothetical protein
MLNLNQKYGYTAPRKCLKSFFYLIFFGVGGALSNPRMPWHQFCPWAHIKMWNWCYSVVLFYSNSNDALATPFIHKSELSSEAYLVFSAHEVKSAVRTRPGALATGGSANYLLVDACCLFFTVFLWDPSLSCSLVIHSCQLLVCKQS